MRKIIYILLGTLSLFTGAVGIVVPGLPTTPFLLLAAALYIRSSDRLYKWLITHKLFGNYIHDFQQKKSLKLNTKLFSIFIMWVMILISVVFLIKIFSIKLVIIFAGVVGTVVMGFIIPTRNLSQ